MAWDFSTEPEFQEQLDWMTQFVREEIWPLETLMGDLEFDQLIRAMEPLREQVGKRGLGPAAGAGPRAWPVGRAPRARARRSGLRPGQARPHARDPGNQPARP